MSTSQEFQKGDIVIPCFGGPVDSEERGQNTKSKAGESSVIRVLHRGGQTYLIMLGQDGKPHQFDAGLFKRRPENAC